MGSNTLTAAVDDTPIPAEHHNELIVALQQELVGRNTNRQPEDLAGSLGSSLYRWLRAYVKEIRIGTVINDLIIYEPDSAPGEIWIENKADDIIKIKNDLIEFVVGGVSKFTFGPSGMGSQQIGYETLKSDKRKVLENTGGGNFLAGTFHTQVLNVRAGYLYKSFICGTTSSASTFTAEISIGVSSGALPDKIVDVVEVVTINSPYSLRGEAYWISPINGNITISYKTDTTIFFSEPQFLTVEV